jgi:hypothetical protein
MALPPFAVAVVVLVHFLGIQVAFGQPGSLSIQPSAWGTVTAGWTNDALATRGYNVSVSEIQLYSSVHHIERHHAHPLIANRVWQIMPAAWSYDYKNSTLPDAKYWIMVSLSPRLCADSYRPLGLLRRITRSTLPILGFTLTARDGSRYR